MTHKNSFPKTKLALIGCGIWGKKILQALAVFGVSVHVYENDAALESVARGLGAVEFSDTWADLSVYDGVILATPSSTHRSLLERILTFSVPVFVEKPLTTSLQDAIALERLNTEKLFVMHIWTYHPGVRMLKDIALSGELGALLALQSTRANWTSPRKDTDTVWNLAPHDVTIAKTIMGRIPEPRYAIAERHNGQIKGFVALFGTTPFFQLHVSNRYENKVREIRANFERGVAVLESDDICAIKILHGDADCADKELRVEYRKYSVATALHLELLDFVSYINGGPAPQCTFSDGMEVVKTIHKLLKLAEDNL